ncbi:alpha/beta fold hydrolase [Wenjunlia tyrosinilytica]|uniref:alpha/beta fold hydrolase n=1 Tax=Wenjunlia tyrosinilytica TaxID=1544741 RepID=UPI0027E4C15A|nr:alpha/beta fold hydrolase [Wenjunlia tyrosinilytica]
MVLRTRPAEVRAAVLVLHGGRADGLGVVKPWHPAAVRMRPFRRAIERAVQGRAVAVGEVRYRHRGWNGSRADAAQDAAAALEELEAALGPVPVVLVGHSMGGRAALRVAGHPAVDSVVALAPWCPEGEPVAHLAGRRVVVLHSDRDGVTDPEGSWEFALRARARGARVCRLVVAGSDHAMLRRAGDWHKATTRLVRGLLGLADLPQDVADALDEGDRGAGGLKLALGPAREPGPVPAP